MGDKVLINRVYKPYLSAIQKEISIESKDSVQVPDYSRCIDIHPIINGYINKEVGKVDSGIESDWFKILPGIIGKRFNGLSLGTGTGRHQIMLVNLGIVGEWNSIDLVLNRGELFNFDKKDKIHEFENDLNFIELPKETYDIIFCHGLLHHIINLESLLFQVNKALTKNGVFIIQDYIGEDQWQWSDQKLSLINRFLSNNFNSIYQNRQIFKFNWNNLRDSRPLESIRSSEIPAIINKIFTENIFEYTSFPILYPIINSMPSEVLDYLLSDTHLLNDFLNKVVEFDKEVRTDNKNILPCLQIGIFKKNIDLQEISVNKWSNTKLRKKLMPDFSYRFPRIVYRKIRSQLK